MTCSSSVRCWIHSWDLWLICIKFLLLTILQVWVMAEILLQYLSGLCEVIINHMEIVGPERRKLSRISKWKPNLQAFKIFSLCSERESNSCIAETFCAWRDLLSKGRLCYFCIKPLLLLTELQRVNTVDSYFLVSWIKQILVKRSREVDYLIFCS